MRSRPIKTTSATTFSVAVALVMAAVLGGCAAQPTDAQRSDALSGASPTASATPVPRTKQDARVIASDAVIDRRVDASRPGCSAAVAVRGEVIWAGARGVADLGTGQPITTTTRFDMASVAKQFTATSILILQREGKLSLSDPISAYVPGLPAWGNHITLEQLMHHTSRIRDYGARLTADGHGFGDPVSHEQVLNAISRLPTLSPGAGYEYSNSNYVLLAEVVHRVSGEPLPDFLRENIFIPLDLKMVLNPNMLAPDVALDYDDFDQWQPGGWAAFGPVGIYSTPSELARWGDQYRAGPIVTPDFAVGAVDDGEGSTYAAGITFLADGSLKHDGRFGGFITRFLVSPDRQTTIVVMCNGHTADRAGITDDLRAIWIDATAQK